MSDTRLVEIPEGRVLWPVASVSVPVPRPQVMWTDLPCQNFHLLVCCAILDAEKQKIMEENYGFNEILKVRRCCRLRIGTALLDV